MRRLTCGIALLAGCTIVDETGYLCSDGSRVRYVDDCLNTAIDGEETQDPGHADTDAAPADDTDAVAPPEDDAAGGRGAGRVRLTAPQPFGLDAGTVYVLGEPGAVAQGVTVEVLGPSGVVSAAVRGTSFVATLSAAEGDLLSLEIDGAPGGDLGVSGALAPPTLDFEDAPGPGLEAPLVLGPEGVASLEVPVAAAGYEGPAVVFNATLGAVVPVAAGIPLVIIPARAGDEVCVAEDDGESLSLANCTVVREAE